MAAPFEIERKAQELFGETGEVAVLRLMRELKVPHRAAGELRVAPHSVRKWIINRGWHFDSETKQWIEPEQEPEHA